MASWWLMVTRPPTIYDIFIWLRLFFAYLIKSWEIPYRLLHNLQNCQILWIHPRSLTARPWKMMAGRWSFPFGKGTFQGRAVKLQVGKIVFFQFFCSTPKSGNRGCLWHILPKEANGNAFALLVAATLLWETHPKKQRVAATIASTIASRNSPVNVRILCSTISCDSFKVLPLPSHLGPTWPQETHCVQSTPWGGEVSKETSFTHLANGPWKKRFELYFPYNTKYVIPKSLKFSHWLSEFMTSRPDWLSHIKRISTLNHLLRVKSAAIYVRMAKEWCNWDT